MAPGCAWCCRGWPTSPPRPRSRRARPAGAGIRPGSGSAGDAGPGRARSGVPSRCLDITKLDLDGEAALLAGVDGQAGAVGGGDGAHDRQPQAVAVGGAQALPAEALERLEEALDLVGWDDRAGVAHG